MSSTCPLVRNFFLFFTKNPLRERTLPQHTGPHPTPPWQDPLNPDPYTNLKPNTPTRQHTIDYYLTKNHYADACHKASAGKAPGLDAIPNEILKHLPEPMHDLIYLLFRFMAKYSYTPKKWCTSATKLIYKPNKTNPHNPTN